MTSSLICNVPENLNLGTTPDKWKTRTCLLDYVSVFSEKDLTAMGINQRCLIDLGFAYASEVARLPTPFIQNSFLYFFWFVDRNLHKLRPFTIPRSKLRCHLLFLAARKSCQHVFESCGDGLMPIPKVRTSRSVRKQVLVKSTSEPEMLSLSPIKLVNPIPADPIEAEVSVKTESEPLVVDHSEAVVSEQPKVSESVSAQNSKRNKRNRTEARRNNQSLSSSSEPSGCATPKRRDKKTREPVYLARQKQEALETGLRAGELEKKFKPKGDKDVTCIDLYSLTNMPDVAGLYAATALINASPCNEDACSRASKAMTAEDMQCVQLLSVPKSEWFAAPPENTIEIAQEIVGDILSCKSKCSVHLFIAMLQRSK